ncbi:hypothetical protein PY310_18185 [Pseudarthrobacter sp. H3Y2-7]|uniref:hypothetical protein n=1 Tax=Pseudarthrobacter naphthalenicus TaxID=3031328 RepID=UPI0023B11961|nr:hypothetical protein [Pseudarthrobacter sp. H3Y2-7]MDE8670512.1 hypothetical protein [Pseudarthrobacter sp. H3Y2-7]
MDVVTPTLRMTAVNADDTAEDIVARATTTGHSRHLTLNAVAMAVLGLLEVEASNAYTLDGVANIVEQSTRDGMLTDTSGTLTAAFEFAAKQL